MPNQYRSPSHRQLLALAVSLALAQTVFAGEPAEYGKPHLTVQLAPGQPEFVDGFIVAYRSSVAAASSGALRKIIYADTARKLGIAIHAQRRVATGADLIRTDRMLDKAQAARLMQELSRDPNVAHVSVDARFYPLYTPDDPLFAQQWHYGTGPGGIKAEQAWDIADGAGSVVAVIDTGVTVHSDLVANLVPGYDFISDPISGGDGNGRDPDASDTGPVWHGTHVAGTIAATTGNGNGVAGVAFGAKVQPIRALGTRGGTFADIIDSIVWASGGTVDGVPDNATPAEVINLSLGAGIPCDPQMQAALDLAIANGTTVVVAAGNDAADAMNFSPAGCEGVVTVAATGPLGELAGFSNFGEAVEVAAPGGSGSFMQPEDNVLSTWNTGVTAPDAETYAWLAGTSMAAPHVAGIVALMRSAAPAALTPLQVSRILINTAYPRGFPQGCRYETETYCGSGIVDARYAVAVAAGTEPLPADPPPPPELPPAAPGIPLQNGVVVTGISPSPPQNGYVIYELSVPNGASELFFGMFGGGSSDNGEADLSVRFNRHPTDARFDCRPFRFGNVESCYFATPQAGRYFARVSGSNTVSDISLYARFVDPGWARNLVATVTELSQWRKRVALRWDRGGRKIDLVRNGRVVHRDRNQGAFVDTFHSRGSGAMAYKVCNAGTQQCSNEISIRYGSSSSVAPFTMTGDQR